MKVAVIHSFYRAGLPSGENAAVVQQVETLRESGCEVLLIAKSSNRRRSSEPPFRTPHGLDRRHR